jgi:hypothetical protein
MERRTGAIEREKRDVAKGKLRIKTKKVLWASETHTRKERAHPPPPFETDGFLDESGQSQASTGTQKRAFTFETHEASTIHPDHSALGCLLRLFSGCLPIVRPVCKSCCLLCRHGRCMSVVVDLSHPRYPAVAIAIAIYQDCALWKPNVRRRLQAHELFLRSTIACEWLLLPPPSVILLRLSTNTSRRCRRLLALHAANNISCRRLTCSLRDSVQHLATLATNSRPTRAQLSVPLLVREHSTSLLAALDRVYGTTRSASQKRLQTGHLPEN